MRKTLLNWNTSELVKLGYEEEMLKSFRDYDSGYIGDVITEIADNYVFIYNHELWELAPKIRYFIEESIVELGTPENGDLIKVFQVGQYYYNSTLLYDNIPNLIFSWMINYIDANYPDIFINIDDYIDELEELATKFDNNDKITTVETKLIEWIEEV